MTISSVPNVSLSPTLLSAEWDGTVIHASWAAPTSQSPVLGYEIFIRLNDVATAGPKVPATVLESDIAPPRNGTYDVFVYAKTATASMSWASNYITVTVTGIENEIEFPNPLKVTRTPYVPPPGAGHDAHEPRNRLAFIIDGKVKDILTVDDNLAAIQLSDPIIVDVTDIDPPVDLNDRYDPETKTFSPPAG